MPKAVRLPSPSSAVLITSATKGVRDNGSGFCVSSSPAEGAAIVTCAHVVRELQDGGGELRVNGHRAVAISTAEDRGIDLAVLRVHGVDVSVVGMGAEPVAQGHRCAGLGYVHLHGGQYVSTAFRGTVDQILTIRGQLSPLAVTTYHVTADKGSAFAPGNSGSALVGESGAVIGVLAYASRDGTHGYALSIDALRHLHGVPGCTFAADGGLALQSLAQRPLPPELPPISVPDDLQKNRFGGSPTDGVVELQAGPPRVSGRSFFSVDLSVAPVVTGIELKPPARFYLHDTFPRSVIQISKRNTEGGFTLSEVVAYGTFTVGCHVFASDERWHSVEYDLADLPGLPPHFVER